MKEIDLNFIDSNFCFQVLRGSDCANGNAFMIHKLIFLSGMSEGIGVLQIHW